MPFSFEIGSNIGKMRRRRIVEWQYIKPRRECLNLISVFDWFCRFLRAVQEFGKRYRRDAERRRLHVKALSEAGGAIT
ncbi:hypothetical protein SAMN04244559_01045 [Magnetospirillum fulvum]|uniref:Uncharacterized protein n=1 Tax=Magnetospirillum fulvum TaxID=1082 RepID=A0A1H6HAM9_MAGFU|nr:hypothetical protein SAMN04244559_01045 [Magnetospirillum fulvum]